MRWAVALVVVTGCRFSPSDAFTGDDDVPDMKDASTVLPDGRPVDAGDNCFGADPYLICLERLPTLPLTLGDVFVNTDPIACEVAGGVVVRQAAAPDLCVLSGTTITVVGTVRATGSLPLVLVATGDLEVTRTGVLDVSSFIGALPGAGASYTGCVAGTPAGSDNNGAGGGAGGSFGTIGGEGGDGPQAGGAGATPGSLENPTLLHAGCAGSAGGGGGGGAGGAGGGAVYLVAGGMLTIAGRIDASAEGGRGAFAGKHGGGGGGSGGMIALFGETAITIDPLAEIFANGAGGGAGSDNNLAGNGRQSTSPSDQPAGGTGGAANGGAGAIAEQLGSNGANSSKGAGGGGGGVGVIENVSGQPLASGQFSPAPR